MRQLTAFTIALFLFINVKSQRLDPASIARLSPDKQTEVNEYLRKAKASKTTAMILSIGGGTLAIAGVAVAISEISNDVWFDGNDPTSNTGDVLFITGAVCALGSVPFFINIHKQRNKARAVLYSEKGVSLAPQMLLPNTQSAGLKIIIPLGK